MVADQNKAAKVKAALERSKKLIQMESKIDKIAKTKKDDINFALDPSSNVTTESMVSTRTNRNIIAPSASGVQINTNVPSVIRESFMNNHIDDSALYSAFGNDGLDVSFLTESLGQSNQQVQANQVRQILGETVQQQQIPMVQNQGVDYPMIRTIVEETVRKYTASLKKSLMTESKQSSGEIDTLVLGKGFKFLDKQGNLYECTFKKISNINDRKKTMKD